MKDHLPSAPFAASVAITARCNLRCKHCFATGGAPLDDELSTPELIELVHGLARAKIFWVTVTGGEPLCHDDLLDILSSIEEHNMRCSLNTNCTLVSKSVAQKLAAVPVRGGISVSLDGSKAVVVDAIRGAGVFKRTVIGIEQLIECGLTVRGVTVVNKYNQMDLLNIARLARELGLVEIDFNDMVGAGCASVNALQLQLTPSQRKYAVDIVDQLSEEYPGFIGGAYLQWGRQLKGFSKSPERLLEGKQNTLDGCGAAFSACTIRPDGWVVPCDALWDVKAGNVRQEDIVYIWRSSRVFNEFRRLKTVNLGQVPGCSDCQYNTLCHGGCRASAYHATGNLAGRDPFCWY